MITRRRALVCWNASLSVMPLYLMSQEITTVADLDMPNSQCTSTAAPFSLASSEHAHHTRTTAITIIRARPITFYSFRQRAWHSAESEGGGVRDAN
jgi:hypothetical protein